MTCYRAIVLVSIFCCIVLGVSNGLGASRDHHPGNAEQLRERLQEVLR